MRALPVVAVLVGAASASKWPLRRPGEDVKHYTDVDAVPASFDCGMRKLAYKYGKQLLTREGSFESLYYALDLNSADCNTTLSGTAPAKPAEAPLPDDAIYVSPTGNDAASGSLSAPLQSVQKALDVAASSSSKTVVLREGKHYLSETIMVSPRHSNIEVRSYPGEKGVMTGGTKLNVKKWEAHDTSSGKNIWKTNVKGQPKGTVQGLQINGVRATRARYPNLPGGIEVSPGYDGMVSGGDAKWTPPDFSKFGPVQAYTDETKVHYRNDTHYGFNEYMIGINGLCSVYDPPVSYWCSAHTKGGGAFAFRTPRGIAPKAGALPNAPYGDTSEALMFVWRPSRWANWMFEVESYDAKANNFTFGKGGNQGARGNNNGGDFFVEGIMEELDYPGEFFLNSSTGDLFLSYNGTGSPPLDLELVIPTKPVLVNMTGTQWNPVKNFKMTDVSFTASGPTFMGPHGVPSAGDWALDRFGAVFLEGTEGAILDGCTFDRLDGNGVMVSGYNRNATIQNSDFSYLGGNAVAAWGYTNETSGDNHPQAGVDGTDGNHPRYTTVKSCLAREVGLYEKQSSFFIQAKTAQSIITGNVFFNGPRAGINANDGFGGGDDIGHNLVFSTCRESGDHGPFNSWDRQPFLTTVRDGTPSMYMAWRHIHHNFFMDNYSPQENVDNDDGSCYYRTEDNFFVYGNRGMKNDFGGHDNHHERNIYAYTGTPMGDGTTQLEGHEDRFIGNTVVMTTTDVGRLICSGTGATVMGNNSYYTHTGKVTECGKDLAAWMKEGHELGSTVSSTPSDDQILSWAAEKLGIN